MSFRSSIQPIVNYTRLVSLTKVILILIALLLIGIIIALPFLNPVHGDFKVSFTAQAPQKSFDSDEVMINPRFQGTDEKKQPYVITAATASKDSNERLTLSDPKGKVTFTNNQWLTVEAKQGYMEVEQKTIDLINNVSIYSSEGYEMLTQSIHVDLENASVFGSEKVYAVTSIGSLEADSFFAEDGGQRIGFNGNVKMQLFLNNK